MKQIRLITDGACRGNPGPGGWAAILHHGSHEKVLTGREDHTTNQRMELTALLRGLEALKTSCDVEVITDSKYVADGYTEWLPNWISRGWRTASNKPVANDDLWRAIYNAGKPHQLRFTWVKGHAGHGDNERVDQLAVLAIKGKS